MHYKEILDLLNKKSVLEHEAVELVYKFDEKSPGMFEKASQLLK